MAKNELIPVYVFTGFLEGGKTKFIQESMEDKNFNSGEKTLLIQCEYGIEEYDENRFWGKNTRIVTIDDESQMTKDHLTKLGSEHMLDRVIIEYNGMWPMAELYDALPDDWGIYQQILFADANTFISYNANMRQLMFDKIMNADMTVLNRTPQAIDKEEIHKIIRGVNRRCQIVYDYPDTHVEYDDIEDPLPFDIDADVIKIADEDFAIWYRDLSEEMKKYDGKTASFKALVSRGPMLPEGTFIAGRHVMACCANDIQYQGLLVKSSMPVTFASKDWVDLTATIKIEYSKVYRQKGPVLYLKSSSAATPPEEEVVTFY